MIGHAFGWEKIAAFSLMPGYTRVTKPTVSSTFVNAGQLRWLPYSEPRSSRTASIDASPRSWLVMPAMTGQAWCSRKILPSSFCAEPIFTPSRV
ncbi:Uncharacterised protein [Mycobacteroides abscessus]|nr:Uncharacterised protein [Mycobacteroides abscessus]